MLFSVVSRQLGKGMRSLVEANREQDGGVNAARRIRPSEFDKGLLGIVVAVVLVSHGRE